MTLQLISLDYQKLNKDFHNECETYGTGVRSWSDVIIDIIKTNNIKTVLDYGCGKGLLRTVVNDIVKKYVNYDPCIEEFSHKPEDRFDLILCLDVMEHVEPQYTDNVFHDIFNHSNKLVYFNIATSPAKKTLPDGRNTHINLKSNRQWLTFLQRYFNFINISTVSSDDNTYTAINYFGVTLRVI